MIRRWARVAFATLMVVGFAVQINAQTEHFHPKGNPPSEYTIKVLEQAQVIAPKDFTDFAIFETVHVGNAMTRRAFFQYCALLPVGPFGHVGMGLVQNVAAGESSLIAPTISIEELTVDGVSINHRTRCYERNSIL